MSSCLPVLIVPGPQGGDGSDGTNGSNGVNAYTTVSSSFSMPAEGADVTVSVGTSLWMTPFQVVYVQNCGWMQVRSKPGATSVVLRNLENTASSLYTDNVAPATSVANGNGVSPAGLQGPAGSIPGGALLAANDLSDLNSVPDARDNLGLGTSAIVDTGVADNLVVTVDDAAGLINGEIVFATAGGIETQDDATARASLGLGSMATQAASAVAITGGTVAGITDLAVADGGTGASTPAAARTNLNVLAGYGILGSLTAVNCNSANNDNAVTIGSARYRIDKIMVDNASISLTTATAGLFTAAGGGGTTLAADQALSALTASTKFDDLTPAGVVATDIFTSGTLYFRTGTAQGAPATVNVFIIGWKLD